MAKKHISRKQLEAFLLTISVLSGAKAGTQSGEKAWKKPTQRKIAAQGESCRSRQELSNVPFFNLLFEQIANSNEYLLANIGFDTAENEPLKV